LVIADGAGFDELDHWDIPEVQAGLVDRELSSVALSQRCRDRIDRLDPVLAAVLAVDPTAPAQAAASDERHAAGDDLGPLDGIPILVKDNIDTAGLASTAGSRLLAASPPSRDADVVTRLRSAGAVIVGKTNLSEWSNFRSTTATEGWSAVGGQTRNPYRLDRSPWGSSAGSAAGVAAGLAPLALGTETDGSIVGPAGVCGVVGVKPELGLLPAGGIVPISTSQDTVGVLASRVRDAAVCLSVLAGQPDLAAVGAPVVGQRLGLWLPPVTSHGVRVLLESARTALQAAGTPVVDVDLEVPEETITDGLFALYAEFRPSIEGYLRTRSGVPRSLPEIIRANRADPVELSVFGQDLFERIVDLPSTTVPAARAARERARLEARAVINDALRRHGIAGIMAPTNEPAWAVDHRRGDPSHPGSSTLAALAGYPNVSVPAGLVGGLPVGISVFGPRTALRLLPLAMLVERRCGPRAWPDLGEVSRGGRGAPATAASASHVAS